MSLASMLRKCIQEDTRTVTAIARQSGVSQSTLQEFVCGKKDGVFADIRLSTAEKLLTFYQAQGVLQLTHKVPAHKKRR